MGGNSSKPQKPQKPLEDLTKKPLEDLTKKPLEDLTESELRAKAEAYVDDTERILVLQEKAHAEARENIDRSSTKHGMTRGTISLNPRKVPTPEQRAKSIDKKVKEYKDQIAFNRKFKELQSKSRVEMALKYGKQHQGGKKIRTAKRLFSRSERKNQRKTLKR